MRDKEQPGSRRPAGFTHPTPVATALAWIDKHVSPLEVALAPLIGAAGRVLAEPVAAAADVPPFTRAAVDGIAVRAEETLGASAYNPLSFRLLTTCEALPTVGAARVNAGALLPGGADAVVPLEQVSLDTGDTCEIIDPVVPGIGVERAGSHAVRGAILLPTGRRLRPHDIGLLASAGVARVPVVGRPEVRVVITGRSLSPPEAPSSSGAICDADGPLLRALIERDGGTLADLRYTNRDRAALRDALAAPGPDIVLVVGGTGNGAHDVAAAALAEAGTLAIHGMALCPGDSAGMGRVGASLPVFLLPGAPAACLWAYEFFAGRAIRRFAGRHPMLPFRSQERRTMRKIVSRIGMTEVRPVRCQDDASVEPIVSFDELGLMAAARADGFVIIPEGSEGFAEGATVAAYLYDEHDGLSGPLFEEPGCRP